MINNENTLYCIIPVVDITQRFINISLQTSANTLRLSNDRNNAIFKFDVNEELAKETFADYEWKSETDIKKFLNTDSNWTQS